MIKHICFLVLICLIGLCAPAGIHAQNTTLDTPQSITVSIAQSYPPMYFLDQQKNPQGWLVDLWRLWSQKTGIKVIFAPVPFGESIELVSSGKANVHAGLYYSDQRNEYLDFVLPLAKANTSIFFHRDIYGIDGARDLGGYKVGYIKGDLAEQYLKKRVLGASLVGYDTNQALFLDLKRGNLKVFVSDTPVARYYLQQQKLQGTFQYHPGNPLYQNQFLTAVKKGDSAMADLVRQGFKQVSEPERLEIEKRWSGVVRTAEDDLVTIAADRDFQPFTWLNPLGQPAGILVDLWRSWAAKTGRRISFVFGNRSDTLHDLKSGRALLHSGLFKNPSHKDQFDYSLPLLPVEVNLFYGAQAGMPDPARMQGSQIGILFDTGYSELLAEKIPGARATGFNRLEDMLQALAEGRLDGAVDVGVKVDSALRRLGLSGRVLRHPKALEVQTMYAGVKKGRKDLIDLVNHGLRSIPQEEMVGIEKRWIADPQLRRYQKLLTEFRLTPNEKAWLAKHPEIRLGVESSWLPFDGISPQGNHEGISSSYVTLLAKMLKINMILQKGLSWSQVLQKARAGEIDVVPCVAPTPKRSEYLLFTRPYISYPDVVVTRKKHPLISGLSGPEGRRSGGGARRRPERLYKQQSAGYKDIAGGQHRRWPAKGGRGGCPGHGGQPGQHFLLHPQTGAG